MSRRPGKWAVLAAIFAVLVLCDQATKFLAVDRLTSGLRAGRRHHPGAEAGRLLRLPPPRGPRHPAVHGLGPRVADGLRGEPRRGLEPLPRPLRGDAHRLLHRHLAGRGGLHPRLLPPAPGRPALPPAGAGPAPRGRGRQLHRPAGPPVRDRLHRLVRRQLPLADLQRGRLAHRGRGGAARSSTPGSARRRLPSGAGEAARGADRMLPILFTAHHPGRAGGSGWPSPRRWRSASGAPWRCGRGTRGRGGGRRWSRRSRPTAGSWACWRWRWWWPSAPAPSPARSGCPLHTYGLLLALAFILGVVLAQREARRRGQQPEQVADLAFWILVAALVLGSQVFYVLLNLEEFTGARFLGDPPFQAVPRFLLVWKTGLVFYGGFIGATLAACVYMRRHRMPFLAYADTLIPSVAFGHFLGRLGCFSAGCCWGGLAHPDLPWAVHFPPGSSAYEAFTAGGYPRAVLRRRPPRHRRAPPDPALRGLRGAPALRPDGAGDPAPQAVPRSGAGKLARRLRLPAGAAGALPRRPGPPRPTWGSTPGSGSRWPSWPPGSSCGSVPPGRRLGRRCRRSPRVARSGERPARLQAVALPPKVPGRPGVQPIARGLARGQARQRHPGRRVRHRRGGPGGAARPATSCTSSGSSGGSRRASAAR